MTSKSSITARFIVSFEFRLQTKGASQTNNSRYVQSRVMEKAWPSTTIPHWLILHVRLTRWPKAVSPNSTCLLTSILSEVHCDEMNNPYNTKAPNVHRKVDCRSRSLSSRILYSLDMAASRQLRRFLLGFNRLSKSYCPTLPVKPISGACCCS